MQNLINNLIGLINFTEQEFMPDDGALTETPIVEWLSANNAKLRFVEECNCSMANRHYDDNDFIYEVSFGGNNDKYFICVNMVESFYNEMSELEDIKRKYGAKQVYEHIEERKIYY